MSEYYYGSSAVKPLHIAYPQPYQPHDAPTPPKNFITTTTLPTDSNPASYSETGRSDTPDNPDTVMPHVTEPIATYAPKTLLSQSSTHHLSTAGQYIFNETRRFLASQNNHATPDEAKYSSAVQSIQDFHGEHLSKAESDLIVAALCTQNSDYGVLTPLLNDARVNDIIVRSPTDISIQIDRTNIQTDLSFPSDEAYSGFVDRMLAHTGKACTTAHPLVDVALSPTVRLSVVHKSLTPEGMYSLLTLRVSRHRDVSLNSLHMSGLGPSLLLNYLRHCTRTIKASILIAGEVGTGKTTLVRALAKEIDPDESILIIEDTNELSLERPFTRTILTREVNSEGHGLVTPDTAIRAGMRMAMNRIILGEMRDPMAAEAFVDACASGHPGMSTIHSRSARDALVRLELFLLRAQRGVDVHSIRRQIANSITLLVFLGMDRNTNTRRIMEVVEVGNASDGAIQVTPIASFIPDDERPSWRSHIASSTLRSRLPRDYTEHHRAILQLDDNTY